MKVLVIGCGSIGSRHARNLSALGADVGLWDTDRIELPRTADVAPLLIFRSLHAGICWSEAVVIASPARCHAHHLASSLAQRRPTFVEKPLSLTGDRAIRDLASLADGWSVPVQVGYNLRFHGRWSALRASVQAGDVGLPDRGAFAIVSNMATWPGRSYADPLAECSHEIDQALWMLGPARCLGAVSRDQGHSWDLLLRHDQGATSTVHINTTANYTARSAAVCGSECVGGFSWDGRAGLNDMYVDEMRHFLEVADLMVGPRCTLQDGLAVLDIMDQARRLAS